MNAWIESQNKFDEEDMTFQVQQQIIITYLDIFHIIACAETKLSSNNNS